MVEKTASLNPERPKRNKQLNRVATLIGGVIVAVGAAVFLNHHEVQAPEEAAGSITVGYEVVTYIDEPEIPAVVIGTSGLSVAILAASQLVDGRRRNSVNQ